MTHVSLKYLNMPKQTFFNLPEEKRATIMKAAMDEFAEVGFDLSSIQKIIKASGIPRGSFYQYFEDKGDLFVEVIFEIAARKLAYLKPVIDKGEDYGMFELLKELVKAGVEFGINDPVAFKIGKSIMSNKTLDLSTFVRRYKARIYERNQITEESLYAKAIQNSLDRGEIDSRFSFSTIMTYANRMMEAMSEKYWEHMADKDDVHAGDEILNEMIHVLRYGLSSNNKPS
jgi:AcrR family transcriptional regulator